jgi:hypothetical protein
MVFWNSKNTPKATPFFGFVKAEDEKDAKRIMEENLDGRYYKVVDVSPATINMVESSSITVNFKNIARVQSNIFKADKEAVYGRIFRIFDEQQRG